MGVCPKLVDPVIIVPASASSAKSKNWNRTHSCKITRGPESLGAAVNACQNATQWVQACVCQSVVQISVEWNAWACAKFEPASRPIFIQPLRIPNMEWMTITHMTEY